MAETEKEGRPPENKRSRKPAHPVKREINEEMKSFAESTMNELLGWYGYDKVELRDSDNLDIGETAQHISVLKENMLPKLSAASEGGDGSPDDRANSSHSLPASRNGHSEAYIAASTSIPGNKEHGNPPIAVPMIPPPLIKPPADEDGTNVQIMCAWCQKVGVKRYSLSMGSELKSFCSEKCFAACRRAYFKRNKLGYVRSYTARDDDGFGGKLPQLSFTQDTARLVCKTNGDVLVCDWCKHIRHTKEYLDFGAGERRLQFCSAKCLNQYKMDIFYKETQAALPGALCNPSAVGDGKGDCGGGVQLLTPESWGTPLSELRRKAPSPLGPSSSLSLAACSSSASSPPHTVCSPTSSVSARMSTPRQHESPTLPPPPMTLHPGVGVPPVSPPMVMTPRGPMPLPLFMEHQMMQQIRPPFLRPSNHPGGPNSPLPNPIIPGIGPPPPTRNHGAASNPMHRPLISSHVHPSSNPNPGMMPPHPGLSMPGMPPFPPFNMLPNGHIPFSPMMNFGMPSLAPLVPPPSLLVPYPVIVPLPIPIPIPIPIPLSPKSFKETLEGRDPKPSAPESSDSTACGLHSQDNSGGDKIGKKLDMVSTESQSPERSQINRPKVVESRVKAENSLRNTCQDSGSSQMDGVIDLTIGQRLCQQQLAQRILPGVQVKVEADSESRSPPLGKERVCGFGAEETLSLLRGTELLGSKHFQTKEKSCPAFINGSSFDSCPPTDNLTSPLLTTATALTQSESLPQLQPSPAAPCNVIVNGTGWHSLNEFEPFSEPNGGGVISEGRINGDLEKEALKENNCSRKCEWDCGKRGPVQDEITDAVVGKQDPDCVDEGEHAYSLPLLSTGGCVVIQPVPKPGMDKTAILSCSITAPISASESPELEPPLKRRCLRIRNQNK